MILLVDYGGNELARGFECGLDAAYAWYMTVRPFKAMIVNTTDGSTQDAGMVCALYGVDEDSMGDPDSEDDGD